MSNTVAFITNGLQTDYRKLIDSIRTQQDPANIIALMEGNLLHQGTAASVPLTDRAQTLITSGVDAVLVLPDFSNIMDESGCNFANLQSLQRMKCVDKLVLPYATPGDAADQYADVMINLITSTYCPVKGVKIAVEGWTDEAQNERDQMDVQHDKDFYQSLVELAAAEGIESFSNKMYDCVGSDSEMTALLADIMTGKTEAESKSLSCLAHTLAAATGGDEILVRHTLLRLLMGYRRIDHSVSAMYSYAPFLYAVACNKKGLSLLKEKKESSWIRIYLKNEEPGEQDSVRLLWELNQAWCKRF